MIFRKTLARYAVGEVETLTPVARPGEPQKPRVTGEILNLFETADAGWATVMTTEGKRIVCLG